jgi:hypothetical protein
MRFSPRVPFRLTAVLAPGVEQDADKLAKAIAGHGLGRTQEMHMKVRLVRYPRGRVGDEMDGNAMKIGQPFLGKGSHPAHDQMVGPGSRKPECGSGAHGGPVEGHVGW